MGRKLWRGLLLLLLFLGFILAAREALFQREALPTSVPADVNLPAYYVATHEKVMAITFDISWGDKALQEVLQVLRDYRQTATFFLSGPWTRQSPDIARAIAREGHEIASHGHAHVNLSQRGEGEIRENLKKAREILVDITGQEPRFFRPPNGDFDARVVAVARQTGQETVIWAIDSLDWIYRDPDQIARRVVAGAFPGAIILLHASDSAPATPAALPAIFRQLSAMGYRLVPLSDLTLYGPLVREDPRGRPYKPNLPR
ncbi:MAG: polysaccharide deacetylase family protein [Bacillota bacterium]|nr:polysaccharide deacetylase family protein [Bacillota bacterium]